MRVGIGYDIHALKKGRRLVLGGVVVPHTMGLAGHSDADVVWHAIVDAILGAMGSGDIGELFPDQDPAYKDAESAIFVRRVLSRLKNRGLRIAHVDAVIQAEAPKLGPFKEKIKAAVARQLGLGLSSIGLKAKTNEGFGAVGRRQAIACQAIVSLKPSRPRRNK